MKEINLNFELNDLDGKPLVGNANAGQLVANILVSGAEGEAIKYYDWAITLNGKKPISVDNTDFNKIKNFVNGSNKIVLLAKAQILKYLETIKEK